MASARFTQMLLWVDHPQIHESIKTLYAFSINLITQVLEVMSHAPHPIEWLVEELPVDDLHQVHVEHLLPSGLLIQP